MSTRADREDTAAQEEAVEDARVGLQTALNDCVAECHNVSKALRAKRLTPDRVTQLLAGAAGEWRAVERAEEALLIAMHDLAGARGEDL